MGYFFCNHRTVWKSAYKLITTSESLKKRTTTSNVTYVPGFLWLSKDNGNKRHETTKQCFGKRLWNTNMRIKKEDSGLIERFNIIVVSIKKLHYEKYAWTEPADFKALAQYSMWMTSLFIKGVECRHEKPFNWVVFYLSLRNSELLKRRKRGGKGGGCEIWAGTEWTCDGRGGVTMKQMLFIGDTHRHSTQSIQMKVSVRLCRREGKQDRWTNEWIDIWLPVWLRCNFFFFYT